MAAFRAQPARLRPLRVLLVTRQFPPLVGGTERQAQRLAEALTGAGARVTVLTARLDPTSRRYDRIGGCDVIRVPVLSMRFLGTLLWCLAVVIQMTRRVGATDVVHVFWAKDTALAALVAARVNGLPIVIRPAGGGRFGEAGAARRDPLKRLVIACLRGADAFVALSTTIRDELVDLGIPPARIHCIPNGVPIGRSRPRAASLPRAVFVGRLSVEKNLHTLLRAWKVVATRLPEARLDIVGDGPLRDRLEALAGDLGLAESVTFTGNVSDVGPALSRARVFVQPSFSEGMSAALVEAMVAGLPAVVTRTSGAIDLIEEGRSGKFVPEDDPAAIADALLELLTDEERAGAMGAHARHVASSLCDIKLIAHRHVELYGALLRGCAARRADIPVLMVIATLDNAGAENQMTMLACALAQRGWAVSVVCLTRLGPLEQRLRARGVPVELLGKRGRIDLRTFFRLVGTVRRARRGVIHTWLYTANTYGRLAALLSRAPRVLAAERSTDPWKRGLSVTIDRVLAGTGSHIVVNAAAVRRSLVERRIPAGIIHLIPNAVSLSPPEGEIATASRGRLRIAPRNQPVIGYVGRLSREKGVDVLVSALAGLRAREPAPVLLLVGAGPERRDLEYLAARLGVLDRVVFFGEADDVRQCYGDMDLLVLPSRYEGLPNVLLEAHAAALPVVATRVGGVPEIVSDGVTGLLVPSDDPKALAAAIDRLLDDGELRASLGAAGSEFVAENHSVDGMIAAYEILYRCLLKEKS